MKAPKLVKTKKANSRSQSQLQVGKCNFIEIPTGLLVLFKGLLLKRPLTIPLLKRPQMGSFKKASDELF